MQCPILRLLMALLYELLIYHFLLLPNHLFRKVKPVIKVDFMIATILVIIANFVDFTHLLTFSNYDSIYRLDIQL